MRSQFCKTSFAGCSQGSGARSGDWWARFGGTAGTGEIASLEQEVLIETTDDFLTFWLEIPECDSADDVLSISLDGTEVFHVDGTHSACGHTGYVQQSVDLATAPGGPYNDGLSHTLRFDVETFLTSGGPTSFLVDDVLIDRGFTDPIPSICTAYESCFMETFDPGSGALPPSWSVFEDVPTGPARNWGTTDDGDCGSGPATDGMPGNFTGGSGEAACADSDAIKGLWSAYLCSEEIDLSTADGSRLRFLYNYQFATEIPSEEDVFRVLVGTQPPSEINIAGYAELLDTSGQEQGTPFATPGASAELSLTAFEGSALYICFHYGGDDDEYAQVDDIEVRANTCEGSTQQPPDAPPADLDATDGQFTDKVRLTWTDVDDESYYQVFRCADASVGSCGVRIAEPTGNSTLYDDLDAAEDGSIHFYRIKACNSAGCSAFSSAEQGFRKVPVPAAPENTSATDGAYPDKVVINWVDALFEERYLLYRCADSVDTGTCRPIDTLGANQSEYQDFGASSNGKIHFYRLQACNSSGCSPFGSADGGYRSQFCGDGIQGITESCDDGNALGGDGCSSSCQVELGYECSAAPPPDLINAVADGSFEQGPSSGDWTETSTVRPTQSCNLTSCDSVAGSGPRSGDRWMRFGGTSGTGEVASLRQDLVIETTDDFLTFWLEIPECDSINDFLRLTLDGTEVFRVNGADSACGQAGYVQQTVNLATAPGGPYNDGLSHMLSFDVETFITSGGPTSFLVEDVLIDRGFTDPLPSVCTAYETCFLETFDPGSGGLPAGWTVFEDAAQTHNWGTTDDGVCGSVNGDPTNFTGGAGVAACVDSDAAGGLVDAYLCSDAIDLTSAGGSRLRFLYNYQFAGGAGQDDVFDVLVGTASPNLGNMGSYSPLLSTGETAQGGLFALPGEEASIDLSGFEGSSVYVCFRYGGNNDWYAQIDDVEVRAVSCSGVAPTCTYSLSQPNGGERWIAGNAYSIDWSKSGTDCAATVDLELYEGGSFIQTIATATSDTTFSWTIPADQPISHDYRVKVVDSDNPAYEMESAAPFVIDDPSCNTNIAPPLTEPGTAAFEACDLLIVPPGFAAANGASIRLSSGRDIVLEPGVSVETGGEVRTSICGQSLCSVSPNPMPANCHSCVETICTNDPTCCTLEWDQACVNRVNSDCGLICQ